MLSFRERSLAGFAGAAASVALGIALSAFFWIPAFTETGFVHISRREAGSLNFHNHFLYIQQLFYSRWGYGLSVSGTGDGLSFALGVVHLIMFAISAIFIRRIWRASATAGLVVATFIVLTLVAVFFMTDGSLFIWEHVSLLHPLQFPWRFLSFVALSTSLLCGAPFVLLRGSSSRWSGRLMAAAVVAIFLINFRHADPQGFLAVTDADYSPSNIATKGLPATAREFEPIDVAQFPSHPADTPVTVLAGRASITAGERLPTERVFTVNASEATRLRMNTFFFPGWELSVDGQTQSTSHGNSQGLMDFSVPPGTHSVRFVFRDTAVRRWSTRLTLVALAILVAWPLAGLGVRRFRARRGLSRMRRT